MGSSYVEVQNSENFLPQNLSVSAWVKLYSMDNEVQVVSKYDASNGKSWNLCVQLSTRKPYFNFRHSGGGNRTVFASTQLDLNQWYHIAGSWDGTDLSVYVNGVKEGSQNESGGVINTSSTKILFGSSNLGSVGFIDGLIDEVSIWEIALDEQSMYNVMSQELLGYEHGLFGYWNLNEQIENNFPDITSAGRSGISFGVDLYSEGAPVNPPPAIYGCNDPYAENYDFQSNTSDGSVFTHKTLLHLLKKIMLILYLKRIKIELPLAYG